MLQPAQYFTWCTLHIRRRWWHPTPVLLPGESHGQRSLVGCSPSRVIIYNLDILLSQFWTSPFFRSNCCFLTCIQVSQEAGKVAWKKIPLSLRIFQFVVIHIVKGFNIVNEAEVDDFLEFSCIFYNPTDIGSLISGSSAFSKFSLYIWKFWFT